MNPHNTRVNWQCLTSHVYRYSSVSIRTTSKHRKPIATGLAAKRVAKFELRLLDHRRVCLKAPRFLMAPTCPVRRSDAHSSQGDSIRNVGYDQGLSVSD